MTDRPTGEPISPEVAAILARWAGLPESPSADELAAAIEVLRQGVERLDAIDVEGIEFDFLHPDTRAR